MGYKQGYGQFFLHAWLFQEVCCDEISLMSPGFVSNSDRIAPFGGCTTLLEHYKQTGTALLHFERVVCGALLPGQKYVREFGQAVSFVPVEALESYLDDLLDLGVHDESLFIKKPRPAKRALFLVSLCVLTLGYLALVAMTGASTAALPLLIIVAFFAGLGSAFYFLPRTKVVRRFSFATVVSREIARRRGHDRTSMGDFATRLLSRELWVAKQGAQTGPHPARISSPTIH